MKKILITREQFEQIKKAFEEYDIDKILLSEDYSSGIGPNTYIEFDPKTTIQKDITDYGTW
jgi:hypothetical protein